MNKDININTNQKDYPYKLTPFKLAVLQNFPYIEADFDALTDYGLLCKVVEYLNNVIANQNVVQDNVTALNNAFTELKNYIDTYFGDELAEKVDDKLNEFAENGTLEQMIAKYISNRFARTYNTVADMKSDTGLIAGMYAKTLSYYSDYKGSAEYYITDKLNDNFHFEQLDNNLYAILISKNIDSYQFGIRENIDSTNELQEFFNYAYKHRDQSITLLAGNLIISKTIKINPYAKIILKGIVTITDNSNDDIAFNIISDADEINNDYQGITQLFDNTDGCIELTNSNSEIAKTGCSINSVQSSSQSKRINVHIRGLRIVNYDIGISLNTYNTYFIDFENIEIFKCRIALYVGKNGSVINSGENISFNKCLFTRNSCCIYFDSSIRIDITQSSFDFNSCVIYIAKDRLSANVNMFKCWIEGIGQSNSNELTYFNNFSGLAFASDVSNWYDKNLITLNNCEICHLQGKHLNALIDGKGLMIKLINNIFWFAEDIMKFESIGNDAFNSLFIANNVKNIEMINNDYKYTSHLMIDKSQSLTDALLENESVDSEYKLLSDITNDYFAGYDIDETGNAKSTKIRKVIIDNKKCIELTPPYNGANSYLTIITKNYYNIKDFYRIYSNGALKGFKGTTHTYINFGIKFYDKDLNLLSTSRIGSNYRSDISGIDPLQFFFAYRLEDLYNNSIPKNATYFRLTFQLFALNGVLNDTDINGTTVHFDDPVYFTGFYSFTE